MVMACDSSFTCSSLDELDSLAFSLSLIARVRIPSQTLSFVLLKQVVAVFFQFFTIYLPKNDFSEFFLGGVSESYYQSQLGLLLSCSEIPTDFLNISMAFVINEEQDLGDQFQSEWGFSVLTGCFLLFEYNQKKREKYFRMF